MLAYEVTENAQPAMGSRLRLSLVIGLMLPDDARQTSLNGDTCEVWKSAKLKLMTGRAMPR